MEMNEKKQLEGESKRENGKRGPAKYVNLKSVTGPLKLKVS